MTYQILNIIVITITAAMWAGLEFFQVARPGGQTISAFMVEAGARYSFVPYGWGILTGHFFLSQSIKMPSPFGAGKWWWLGWVVPAVALVVSDLFISGPARQNLTGFWSILFHPMMLLMLGIALSFLFWPQRTLLPGDLP